jgi:lysine 2,3-aminomutase
VANQAVLLRGVNDCARVQAELGRGLLRARVRPYYLMQCDAVQGASHLMTSVRRGVEIVEALRGAISGLGVPTYVLDLPGGGGKVPLSRGSCGTRDGDVLIFEGPGGQVVRYPDRAAGRSCPECICRPARVDPAARADLADVGDHQGLDRDRHGR